MGFFLENYKTKPLPSAQGTVRRWYGRLFAAVHRQWAPRGLQIENRMAFKSMDDIKNKAAPHQAVWCRFGAQLAAGAEKSTEFGRSARLQGENCPSRRFGKGPGASMPCRVFGTGRFVCLFSLFSRMLRAFAILIASYVKNTLILFREGYWQIRNRQREAFPKRRAVSGLLWELLWNGSARNIRREHPIDFPLHFLHRVLTGTGPERRRAVPGSPAFAPTKPLAPKAQHPFFLCMVSSRSPGQRQGTARCLGNRGFSYGRFCFCNPLCGRASFMGSRHPMLVRFSAVFCLSYAGNFLLLLPGVEIVWRTQYNKVKDWERGTEHGRPPPAYGGGCA